MALTKVSYSMIEGSPVNVLDFGADPTGVADSTTAINAAIASGKSVYFPRGTYLTVGSHSISYPSRQRFFGDGWNATIIKKSGGTNMVFDIAQFAECSFSDFTVDANNLGGTVFMWRAHYSTIKNVNVLNVGGTSYGFHISGSNLCQFENVAVQNSYGGFKIDQSSDPLSVNPTYGMLYSSFEKCTADIRSAGESALYFAGSLIGHIYFSSFYFEVAVSNTVKAPVYFDTTCSNVYHITFDAMSAETFGGSQHVVDLNSALIYDIAFNNCAFSVSAAMTDAVVSANAINNLSFESCTFNDLFSTTPEIFFAQSCENLTIEHTQTGCANNFTFFNDGGLNTYTVLRDNQRRLYAPSGYVGAGTIKLITGSPYTVIDGTEFAVLTNNKNGQLPTVTYKNVVTKHSQTPCGWLSVADDAFYDLFGDGGATSPTTPFAGVVIIHALPTNGDIVATSANNFATFYAQSNVNSNAQAYAAITVGSNVEVDVLADGVVPALATTTDGKLGVQIGGGGNESSRAIRIYNRTGATVRLNVAVQSFISS